MAGFILKILLAIIVIRLVWRFVRGVLEGAGYMPKHQRSSVGLVRDPVCGVFVVPSQALTLGAGTQTRYFCSEKCRAEWKRR